MHQQELLKEVIVVDGGSSDATTRIVKTSRARLLRAPKKGRAFQMNLGASTASGDILYFVHADVRPPESCFSDILKAMHADKCIGCFAYRFDSSSWLLQLNAFFTQIDWVAVGGGDQTLFLLKTRFEKLGGFDESLPIMEDFDFIWRAKNHYPIHLVKNRALVSARKYEKNSYLKVQGVNFLTFTAFRWGVSPEKLARWYRRMLC